MSDISIVSLLPSYIQAVAIIAAGGWAYRKFIYQRAHEPATDIDIDLNFVGTQDNKWIIEVTSFLKNQSLVRHEYKDFQGSVRYLLPGDKVEDGDGKIFYQLNFPGSIDERINGGKRFFGNVEYINPRQEFKHRYITAIPIEATFVWVQCKFLFKIRKEIKMNSQRIFRVPVSKEGQPDKLKAR